MLLRKPKCYSEVYNDLDGDLVNLFRVLREPAQAEQLVRVLRLTPFAREEFEASYAPTSDPIERARRLCARSFMGFGSAAANIDRTPGFRQNGSARSITPSTEWGGYPAALAAVATRIQSGVSIENRPALDLIEQHDGPETLFYVDPPYVHSTRSGKRLRGQLYHGYAHDMTDADHVQMLNVLRSAAGMVILSGYTCPLYEDLLVDWSRVERAAHSDRALKRTEVLWLNEHAASALRLAA